MIIIDAGNTNCKIWIEEKHIVKSYSKEFSVNEIRLLKSKSENPILYSSVAPLKFDKILKLLKEIGYKRIFNISEFVQIEKPLGNIVKGIGSDRILGMIGGATFLKAPLITVDCGTAVTVNFLKEKNLCAGGAIFAGYYTQLKALTSGTEGIVFEEGDVFKNAVGTTTEEALQSGIINSIVGGIILLHEKFLKEAGIKKTEVVITGGDGETIFKELLKENFTCVFKNDLIRLGIEEVFKTMNKIQKEKYLIR